MPRKFAAQITQYSCYGNLSYFGFKEKLQEKVNLSNSHHLAELQKPQDRKDPGF